MTPADVDLLDPGQYVSGVPHATFRWLRAEAPVFRHAERDGPGFWAVTRHEEVTAVSRNPLLFSSAQKGAQVTELPPEMLASVQAVMINMDPPQHTKYRRLINQGFTPRRVEQLAPHIRAIASRIIDRVAASGACDFVAKIAGALPLEVIAELLGVPTEDRARVFAWSNQVTAMDDPEYSGSLADSFQASMDMWSYANELALARRANPRDDLVSVLMAAQVDGEQLSEMEFDAFFLLLAVAGNETTRNLIAGGMLALIEHPAERARLQADPTLLPSAIEEMLRFVTPVMCFRRTAMRDTELGGQHIHAGDKVVLYYVSANRDERVFTAADRFDVARTPNDHLAFGVGEHFCLGASLARLESRIMFEELLRRLPDLELAGPARRLRSNFLNGIKEMPVRFTPAR